MARCLPVAVIVSVYGHSFKYLTGVVESLGGRSNGSILTIAKVVVLDNGSWREKQMNFEIL